LRILLLLLLLLELSTASPVSALTRPRPAPPPIPPAIAPAALAVDQAEADLHRIASGLRSQALGDKELNGRIAALPAIQAKLAEATDSLAPRLQAADARLAQLGAPPSAGQPPEDPEIANRRRSLIQFRQAVDTELKQARLLSVEAGQLNSALAERLRKNFTARLWAHSPSVLDVALWQEFAANVPADLGRLTAALQAELRLLAAPDQPIGNLVVLGLAALAAVGLLGPARLILNRLGYRQAARLAPGSRLRRSALAVWLVLIAALSPLVAGLLLRAVLTDIGASTPSFDRLLLQLVVAAVFACSIESLGRALMSPRHPSWRLAPLPDAVVGPLAPFPGLIGTTVGLTALAAGLSAILGASSATSEASDCLGILFEIAVLAAALVIAGLARSAHLAPGAPTESTIQAEARWPWVVAALTAWLALGAALLALLFGYVAMASFLTRETIWIATVLAGLFLFLRFVDDLFPALMSPASPIGRFVQRAVGLSDDALEQIGVLLSGLFRLLLLVMGWAAILARFGAGVDDVVARVTSTSLVIRLGQLSISPGAILGGLAVFLLGVVITRAVRRWIEFRYLPKTRLDLGVQTSLAAGVSYLGVAVAILLASAYLGLSLDRIALLASALSVGIGFGLQAVIGNFVSGLILLVERPLKVGDWIAIGDLEGDVRRINIRATEIEMPDKSKLIVPNSDLISKTVRNVTHAGALGRVKIVLKTVNEADPAKVRDILLAEMADHGEVLADPAAAVFLTDVRDGALEFSAYAYVASARQAYRVRSELLFRIVPALKSRGIVLADPTPVVHVAIPDRLIEATSPSS
jgi:small-conductance mechanosensitive channel